MKERFHEQYATNDVINERYNIQSIANADSEARHTTQIPHLLR